METTLISVACAEEGRHEIPLFTKNRNDFHDFSCKLPA